MEDVHGAAQAYYNHGTYQLQTLAQSFFRSMDADNDGKISCAEFEEFLMQSSYKWMVTRDRDLFARLDRNRDGHLDFQEVLTLYYIIKTTNIWCQGRNCGAHLTGLYFTCVTCFDAPHQQGTFDLCGACYGNFNFSHHHHHHNQNCFLDNHVLLRSKRGLLAAATNLNLAIYTPPPTYYHQVVINHNYPPASAPAVSERTKWFQGLEVLFSGANLAATLCTIM